MSHVICSVSHIGKWFDIEYGITVSILKEIDTKTANKENLNEWDLIVPPQLTQSLPLPQKLTPVPPKVAHSERQKQSASSEQLSESNETRRWTVSGQ